MPLYIKYFNDDEVLGLWYTILSVINWIIIFDFGLGNGLRNRLTEALSLKQYDKAKSFISSTYITLIVIIFPVSIVGVLFITIFDLNSFFNVSTNLISSEVLKESVLILFLGVCLNFVLKIINSIIYAIQKSSLNNILSLLTSLIPIIYIFLFNGGEMERNLISLTIVHVIAINVPLLVSSLILFNSKLLNQCKPSIKNCNFRTGKTILFFGSKFFLAQVFFMFLTTTNEIIITKIFGSSYVVEYSIYYRLFTMIGSLFMLALTPLWSKVTKDFYEKKYNKILNTNRVLYVLSGLAFVLELLLVPLSQFAINLWLQEEAIKVNYYIATIFALYGGIYIFNVVVTTIANALADLKIQIIFYGIGSILKIPVILIMSLFTSNWSIVMLFNSIILLLFCIFEVIWIEKKIKKNILIQLN
ncbi:MAG: MATE family efflux transporter [Bacilli bacterium]|nr:MATE family efflux transporter [Bacilli bacterium]